ncbi:MAG: hypothetical protein ABW192_08090 [Sphingobium sp.]
MQFSIARHNPQIAGPLLMRFTQAANHMNQAGAGFSFNPGYDLCESHTVLHIELRARRVVEGKSAVRIDMAQGHTRCRKRGIQQAVIVALVMTDTAVDAHRMHPPHSLYWRLGALIFCNLGASDIGFS